MSLRQKLIRSLRSAPRAVRHNHIPARPALDLPLHITPPNTARIKESAKSIPDSSLTDDSLIRMYDTLAHAHD